MSATHTSSNMTPALTEAGSNRIARAVSAVPPSGIRRFFDIVAQMEDVISLGVGEPDFVTPWVIREAAVQSLERGLTQYTSNWGLLELRREISALMERSWDVAYRPEDEILVTVGVSEGLDLALRAILNPGDEVVVPQPCYVSYTAGVALAGGLPVVVPTTAETGFRVRAGEIEAAITPRTRAILINYPNNPTGATLSRQDLVEIGAVAQQHDLLVLSDEIYANLTYPRFGATGPTGEARHHCFAGIPGMRDRTLVFNGFSKAYAMTGWRVGYAAGPADILAAMTKIHQYTMLCAPMIGQQAALAACREGEPDMRAMVEQYDLRRRMFVTGLNQIGLPCHEPEGAFYAFPSIVPTGLGCEEFAEALLKEERVAVVPGTAFGAGGEGHVRCSYAASVENLREALVRMGRFVARRVSAQQTVNTRASR